MQFQHHTVRLVTTKPIEITDITSEVQGFVEKSAMQSGLLQVASPHTTVGIVLNERCEKLQEDIKNFFAKLAPSNEKYQHNLVAVDGRPNAHSHLLSLLLPSQLTLMLQDGLLDIGDWQSVFAVELDGPRPERKITLTLMGM